MTLLEMTVVILVLLSLTTVLFIGTRAWKRGSDRTVCIMNIEAVQKGLRAYANLNDLKPGDHVNSLRSKIIGSTLFVNVTPVCPHHGSYSFGDLVMEESIPPFGVLYMTCSLSESEEHVPQVFTDW